MCSFIWDPRVPMSHSEMSDSAASQPPRVSVIVPVRDAAGHVARCLEALCAQTWPADRLELLVVDDGSVDETRGRVRDYPVELLTERGVGSPYAARNAGIARASGEILAFTDSDCTPDKQWVERGVAALVSEAADLVGGRVRFRVSAPARGAEVVDALNNLDHDRSIPERGEAKTGNLFVHRRVLLDVGDFDAERRSGGDVELTRRAVGAGYALVYAPEAVVEKPARRLLPLLRKQLRVGRGQLRLWREQGVTDGEILRRTLRCLLPQRPGHLRAEIRRRGPEAVDVSWPRVWLAAWAAALAEGLGRVLAWLGSRR